MNQRNHDEKMPQDMADELSWWSAFATCAYGTLSSILQLQNDPYRFQTKYYQKPKGKKERKKEGHIKKEQKKELQ